MKKYNLLLIYHHSEEKIIMCHRVKEPYLGLINLPGGKIEEGESGIEAAYRELQEETNITSADVTLHRLMRFDYCLQDCLLEVYVGKLKHEVTLVEEVHPLFWSDLSHDFFDSTIYAGEGNIGHLLFQADLVKESLFLE
ncbi:NUDIX hydrolase [Enterococcus aquimarinus]|uniref:NUDIX hydrolase n=1 Tax=Enterococcus aquimarinus TaxID=328396 RepID=A0A1L8QPQ5_9ENTE|nr:NUDIX domain-containing protein [Enterococcus aquimarinus]OJG09457.1 NUDIX hydrolase [Enterococcus aquimarinus]